MPEEGPEGPLGRSSPSSPPPRLRLPVVGRRRVPARDRCPAGPGFPQPQRCRGRWWRFPGRTSGRSTSHLGGRWDWAIPWPWARPGSGASPTAGCGVAPPRCPSACRGGRLSAPSGARGDARRPRSRDAPRKHGPQHGRALPLPLTHNSSNIASCDLAHRGGVALALRLAAAPGNPGRASAYARGSGASRTLRGGHDKTGLSP